MIDALNGGLYCTQCRHYQKEGIRHDRFFGDIKVKDYCTKFGRQITFPEEGAECPAFLKRIFDGSATK